MSDHTREQRAYALFVETIQHDPAERDRFLSQACSGDPALRHEVESLLRADEGRCDGDMPSLIEDLLLKESPIVDLDCGQMLLGRYRILDVVSRGGMGVVYKAEQQDPKRVVAVKVIRPDRLNEAALKRFESEKEILGQLIHPNIATIYEAGLFDHCGFTLPFFAMEYVVGRPVTEHVRAAMLRAEGVLRLLLDICSAVHYAHEKGVIHCDLKPANILADSDGRPRIIDFGIAFATSERLGALLRADTNGPRAGTPAFMSPGAWTAPEDPATPQTDIYSIGVIACEMLTGRRPAYPVTGPAIADAAGCTNQASETHSPSSALSYELQAIIDKAMHHERAKRYSSVRALATDIESYLRSEPVEATKPWSRPYRLRKWAQRHARSLIVGLCAAAFIMAISTPVMRSMRQHAERSDVIALQHERTATRNAAMLDHSRYATDCVNAQIAWNSGDVTSVLKFLQDTESEYAQQDLRSVEWYHLWTLCHGDRLTWDSGAGAVTALYTAPDGRVMTMGNDAVTYTTPDTHRIEHIVDALAVQARPLCASADCRTIATTGPVYRIDIWDVPSRKVRARLRENTSEIGVAVLSGDGTVLCSVDREGIAKVWDLRTIQETRTFRVNRGTIARIAMSPDGRSIAVGDDRTLKLWDLATGHTQVEMSVATKNVESLSYGASGVMAAGLSDGSILLLDTTSLRVMKALQGHNKSVSSLAFAANGAALVTGSQDCSVAVWDVTSGTPVATLKGHESAVTAAMLSPDGSVATTGDATGHIKVWDICPQQPAMPLKTQYVDALCVSEEDRIIQVLAGAESYRWNPRTGNTHKVILHGSASAPETYAPLFGGMQMAEFLPSGRRIVTCNSEGQVALWDTNTGARIDTLGRVAGRVTAIACCSSGGRLAVADEKGTITIWDTKGNRNAATITIDTAPVTALEWSPDSAILVAGSQDKSIQLYDARTCQLRRCFTLNAPGVLTLSVSPDNTTLIASGGGSIAPMWEIATGREASLPASARHIMCASFSPDGRSVASGDEYGVTVWDVATGDQRARWECKGAVKQLAFSSDGKTLAVAQYDGMVWSFGLMPDDARCSAARHP